MNEARHAFARILLTAVSLDCGYGTSSIRERIYAGEEAFGILLYTSSIARSRYRRCSAGEPSSSWRTRREGAVGRALAARPPELYFDPRSLAAKADERGVIHAKCIVVDGRTALVTSANFTESAHARNTEAGVVVHDAGFAQSLEKQFTSLVEAGLLRRVFP